MNRFILLCCLPLLANAAEVISGDVPPPDEIEAAESEAVLLQDEESSPEPMPADSCPECTPAERDQLRIKEAERLTRALNSLVAELELLSRYPEVSNLLLSEDEPDDLLRKLDRILSYMQQQQHPSVSSPTPVPAVSSIATAAPSAASSDKQNLVGLQPVFAQSADQGRGVKANVILRSHRDDLILNVGDDFSHNNVSYKLYAVRMKDGQPEIVLEDRTGRKRVLPWE